MKTDIPTLKRLGPVPFWRGERRCLDELDRMYRKAIDAAAKQVSVARAVGVNAPR